MLLHAILTTFLCLDFKTLQVLSKNYIGVVNSKVATIPAIEINYPKVFAVNGENCRVMIYYLHANLISSQFY